MLNRNLYNHANANIIQIMRDAIFLFLSFVAAFFIVNYYIVIRPLTEYLWLLILFIPIWVAIMSSRGMYDRTTFFYPDRVMRNIFLTTVFSGLLIICILFFMKDLDTSRPFILTFLILSMVVLFVERCIFGYLHLKLKSSRSRVVVVCTEKTWQLFQHYINKTAIRYNILGILPAEEFETIPVNTVVLGKVEDIERVLVDNIVDEVIFYLPENNSCDTKKYISVCEKKGIVAHLVMQFDYHIHSTIHISYLGPNPMLTFHSICLNPLQNITKRTMDICGALVGMAFTLLVSLVIIPAIKIDSPGPVIFKQKRVGRNGRIFNIYKFRTMCVDAETQKKNLMDRNQYQNGLMFKIKNDPRVTKVGKFLRKSSMDELPQFFNILKGDMSLVGTRPPTLDEVSQYDISYWRRISIKPGLTGMWQINGRNKIDNFDEVVRMDIQYIDRWSIWLDITILLQTIIRVLCVRSAY